MVDRHDFIRPVQSKLVLLTACSKGIWSGYGKSRETGCRKFPWRTDCRYWLERLGPFTLRFRELEVESLPPSPFRTLLKAIAVQRGVSQ